MLPPRRTNRGVAPPPPQDLPLSTPKRAPRVHDKVNVLWEDRGLYYSGTLVQRVKKKKRGFYILYDDGDMQQIDLDEFHWHHAEKKQRATTTSETFINALEFIPGRSDGGSILSETRSAVDDPSMANMETTLTGKCVGAMGKRESELDGVTSSGLCETSTSAESEAPSTKTGAKSGSGGASADSCVTVVSPVSVTQHETSPRPLSLSSSINGSSSRSYGSPSLRAVQGDRPISKDWKRKVMRKFLQQREGAEQSHKAQKD